jgi:N6-L-threonylcarbamoyladenine synthase
MAESVYILGIESSCDDTAAAVIADDKILANVVFRQEVHGLWGGVVPELASRAHLQQIVPVVHAALHQAKITKEQLHAVAYTKGPGLLGALLVGGSYAVGLAASLGIPAIPVNHMQAHVLAHFIDSGGPTPALPFLCLTVSGGHTQIVRVNKPFEMILLGQTTDDAAGEAFDKIAKMLGLPYPGGPLIDHHAAKGDPYRFTFPEPRVPGLDYSFSGLKTSVMNFLKSESQKDASFIEKNMEDLCASVQERIVQILMKKFKLAAEQQNIRVLALAGGVSANSGLRKALLELENEGYQIFIPPFEYCTDNAAMIAITGWLNFTSGLWKSTESRITARLPLDQP